MTAVNPFRVGNACIGNAVGAVVKAGVLPMVRCALLVPEVDPLIRGLGVGTALLGVGYAVFEKDTKRMLAFHTVSQLGFILAAPCEISTVFNCRSSPQSQPEGTTTPAHQYADLDYSCDR